MLRQQSRNHDSSRPRFAPFTCKTGIFYSHLVATVIGGVIIPTASANAFFMPKHLLPSIARSKRARVSLGARKRLNENRATLAEMRS
jgi:hypothetical protein